MNCLKNVLFLFFNDRFIESMLHDGLNTFFGDISRNNLIIVVIDVVIYLQSLEKNLDYFTLLYLTY